MINIVRRLKNFVPRTLRNALRAPRQTWQAMKQTWSYRRGRHIEVKVRSDWEVRCHPASADAFRAHTEIEEVRQELDGFLRSITPEMTLLDIGSHHGVFTLAAIHYGGPRAFVIAVDPSRDINPIFKANVELSKVSHQVQLFEVAAGSSDGQLHMLSTNAAGDRMFVASPPRSDTCQVEMLSVPSIVEKAQRIPTHMKIDVEGFEDEVIRGAEGFISRYKPIIFLELHNGMMCSSHKLPGQLLETVASLGYLFEHRGLPISIDGATKMDLCRLIAKPV